MKRVIRIPNGHHVSLKNYVASWRALKAMPDKTVSVKGWDHFPERANRILADLMAGMHDRINQHDPAYGRGRKWDRDWQIETRRAAHALNQPRLAIHWLPNDLRARFAHRLDRSAA